MNFPRAQGRTGLVEGVTGSTTYGDHIDQSRRIQKKADRWLMVGAFCMGTLVLGVIGFPIFMYGLTILRRAGRSGLSVRPMMVTLIGFLVFIDAALNSFGWALDLVANHTLINRTVTVAWGNFFDAGYFWHYNELRIGGAGAPGEKSWELACILVVFPMRMAAAYAFLQMKRWGHQWLIVTCWFGVVIWVGYTFNMTIYGDLRYTHIGFPVIAWWIYDIFYITPFLAIPYLHTVNREIFTD
ncbi:hypothetical protein [Mycobacterium sp. 94-17]|uniref:hypothetical protein n=1 Tax=Mycobacterium sp. 94-17 TaxID=2986147 RepID=UPI003B6333F8